MKKILFVGLLMLMAVIFLLPESIDENHAKNTLVIAVSRTPLSAPIYIASARGLFKKHGVDIRLEEVIGGSRSFRSVIEQRADFATCSESVLMFASLRGEDYVNLSSFVESDNDIKLISRADAAISQFSDLSNKRIGYIRASASEYFLSIVLALGGVDIREVELHGLDANEIPSALQSGLIDTASVWEPYAFEAGELMDEQLSILPGKNLHTLSFNLVTRPELTQRYREDIPRMLKAIDEAIQYIAVYPQQSQAILKQRLQLNDAFIDWIWPDYNFRLSLSRSLLFTLQEEAKWAINSGLSDNRQTPDFLRHIDKQFLFSIKPEAVTL